MRNLDFKKYKNSVVGLAISGGPDSIFLAHLLNENQIPFVAIHCNYQLRGADSEDDAAFVKEICLKLQFCKKVIIKKFDTKKLSQEWSLGIQETARKIRYDLFDKLHQEGIFENLFTAHHADDQVETFFLHLYRKSGLKGLRGIPTKRDYIQRPLLAISKKDILEYLNTNQINYRLDKSNEKNDYLRNKIRNSILPIIEKELPDFSDAVKQSINYLKEDWNLFEFLVNEVKDKCIVEQKDGFMSLNIRKLVNYPQSSRLLYEMIDTYGFSRSDCQQILQPNTKIGAQFTNEGYVMIKTQTNIEIHRNNFTDFLLNIPSEGIYPSSIGTLIIEKTNDIQFHEDKLTELVDLSQFPFPLTLRYWREKDYIIPLGMKGKKLLSDFFTDLKINPLNRKSIPLLANGNEILWIVGYRISDVIKIAGQKELHFLKFEKRELDWEKIEGIKKNISN